jgi:hypothetical protein
MEKYIYMKLQLYYTFLFIYYVRNHIGSYLRVCSYSFLPGVTKSTGYR